jgi:hypothetical protein
MVGVGGAVGVGVGWEGVNGWWGGCVCVCGVGCGVGGGGGGGGVGWEGGGEGMLGTRAQNLQGIRGPGIPRDSK